MRKRFFSLFLALAMAVTLLPAQAFAAERIPLGPTAPTTQKRPERTILRGREVQDQTAQQETVQQPATQNVPVTVQNAPAPRAADITIDSMDKWNEFVKLVNGDAEKGIAPAPSTNAVLATNNIMLDDTYEPIAQYNGIFDGDGHTISGVSTKNIFTINSGTITKLFVSGTNICETNRGAISHCGAIDGQIIKSNSVVGVTYSYCANSDKPGGTLYLGDNVKENVDTFAVGRACWLLNEEKSTGFWRQNLGNRNDKDIRPVLDITHDRVFYGYETNAVCTDGKQYTNAESTVTDTPATHAGFGADGKCTNTNCNGKITVAVSGAPTESLVYGYTAQPPLSVKVTPENLRETAVTGTYQWYEGTTAISGATAATYDFPTGKSVGTYTYSCKFTYNGSVIDSNSVTVQVVKSDTTVEVPTDRQEGLVQDTNPKIPDPTDTSEDPKPIERPSEAETPKYAYKCIFGDVVQMNVTVAATNTPAPARARALNYTAPTANQVAAFHGATQVSAPVTVENDGVAKLYIKTKESGLAPRQSAYMLEIRYIGTESMADKAADVALTVNFATASDATASGGVTSWTKDDVELTPPDEWQISESVDDWANSLIISEDSNDENGKEYIYYLKNNTTGQIAKKTVTLKIDTVSPNVTAEVTERQDNSAKITVTGYADGGSPIAKYSLKLKDGAALPDSPTGKFEITGLQPTDERVYIATVTDEAGNVSAEREVAVYKVSKSLNDAEIGFEEGFDYTYDGAAKEPAVTVSIAGAEVPNTQYDVAYEKNINAGSATVTITGKDPYSGTKTGNFTIAPKPVTAVVTVTDRTYDGTDKATVTATVNDSDLETQGTTKDVVTITGVTGTFASANAGTQDVTINSANMTVSNRNYDVTVPETIKGTINPLALTKFALPGEDIEKTYDGSAVSMSVVEIAPESAREDLVSSWTKSGSSEALSGDPTNAGEYTLTVSLENPDNYTYPTTEKSLTKQVIINKAETTPKTDSKILIRNGFDNETVYFNFDTLFPKPESPRVFGNPTYTVDKTGLDAGYRDITEVKTTGQQLSVHVSSTNQDTEGEVGKIKVTMTSDNYNPATAIITVSATSKEIVKISGVSITGGSKTYDGKPVELVWNPKAMVGSDEVILNPEDFKRSFSDGTNHFTDPPKKAGEYTLTVSVDTSSASGLLEIPFKIAKREVEWDTSGLTAVKKYDGTMAPPAVTGELKLKPATEGKGFIEGDDVQLVIGELLLAENFTHAGAHSELLPLKKVWELTGTDAGNYRFPTELPKVSAEITSDGKPGDSSGSDIALDVKDPSGKALKLVRTSGIPESAITQDLKDKGFDTETKIKAEMEKSLTADQKKNSVLYDLKLMVQDGSGWKEATAANFPAAGITVNLPYPSGTNKNDKFTIVHMFSTTANSKTAGQTETLSGSAVTNLDKAIRFKLTGLSPVLVTWTKSTTSGGDTTDKDDDKDDNDEETYRVRIADLSHGKITARPTRAEEGETVTLTVKPDSGYRLSSITVTDRRGKDVKLKEKSDTKYTFKMPARWVEVDATFVATTPTYTPTYPTTYYPSTQWNSNTTSCTGGASCPSRVFPDLDPAMWYHGSTDFVIQRGLMAGQSDGRFAPNVPLTRAMMVQILYTHAGRPIPSSSASFRDVDRGAWYENAVNWAAEQGVASGIGNNAFAPKSPVTREQLAVMLYNYASRRGISLQATQSRSSFSDSARISSWASSAVTVMQQAGIVSGKQGYIFDPKGRASRAETAQMLWKLLN